MPLASTACEMIAIPAKSEATNTLSRALIRAAGCAPSPDNNQPWAFRGGRNSIEVFHRRSRAVPSDVDDLFAGIALGAAIENLVLEASRHDLRTAVRFAADPFRRGDEFEPVATVHWSESARPDRLSEYISARTTNRRPYEPTALTIPELSELTDAIQEPGCHVAWRTTRNDIRQLARMVMTADRIRFECRSFHDELHAMLRYGHAEARAAGDGLELASLEIPRIAWPLLRWLRPWPRMQQMNRVGFSRLFARNSIVQIRRSGAIGALFVERPGGFGFLNAGRALQRIWLTATRMQLAFQPVGALPLFLRRLAVFGESAFEPHHARALSRARDEFEHLFPEAQDRVATILFRVGRCPPPSARSFRYKIEEIEMNGGE